MCGCGLKGSSIFINFRAGLLFTCQELQENLARFKAALNGQVLPEKFGCATSRGPQKCCATLRLRVSWGALKLGKTNHA